MIHIHRTFIKSMAMNPRKPPKKPLVPAIAPIVTTISGPTSIASGDAVVFVVSSEEGGLVTCLVGLVFFTCFCLPGFCLFTQVFYFL